MSPSTNGKFVLNSGSAGRSGPADKLDVASQFVRSFTGEVLRLGGGTVVMVGDEAGIKDEHYAPCVNGLGGIAGS